MIIRNKFNGYVNGNNRLYPGGGGGPTTTKSETSNIPEYARPYVERMMGSTEKQVYTYNPQGDITGFQPYKPFEGETVAGFTPTQSRAMQGIQNYQLPGQTNAATQMTGYAGLGSMNAGQQYAQQATNPYATQAYMSPYMEGALQPQLREAARQSAIQGQQNQAQAVQAGAFGGSRSAIIEAERQRNLGQQQADIYGKGMQSAFEQARQAQQFGSELGLKGYGQGLQAAGQLGALGQQQYGQETGLLGQQYDVGSKQQAYEQARLNQRIQDYATQQQYPFIQLGTLSNMLRGLPMQASTTQLYQAQPTGLTAGIGLAGAASNLYQAFGNRPAGSGQKEGGAIKEMASGGIATGVDPYKLPGMLEKLSDKQLSTKGEDQQVDPATKEMVDAETARRAGLRKGAGIMQAANGGVVAFKKGDMVGNPFKDDAPPEEKAKNEVKPKAEKPAPKTAGPVDKTSPYASTLNPYLTSDPANDPEIQRMRAAADAQEKEAKLGVEGQMQRKQDLYTKYGIDPLAMYEKQRKDQEEQMKMTKEDARKAEHLRWAQIFAKLGSTPGSTIKAALVAINDGVPDLLEDQAKTRAAQKEIKKIMAELDKAETLYKMNRVDDAEKTDKEAKAKLTDLTLAIDKAIFEKNKVKSQISGELEGRRMTNVSNEKQTSMRVAGDIKVAGIREGAEGIREKNRLDKQAELDKKRADEHTRLAQAEMGKLKYDKERRKDIETAKTIINGKGSEEEKMPYRAKLKEYQREEDELRRRLPSLYPDARLEEVEGATVDTSGFTNFRKVPPPK